MTGSREAGWWRWPLWSWRNLTATLLGAAMLVTGLGRISGGSEVVDSQAGLHEVTVTVSGAPSPSRSPMATSTSSTSSGTPGVRESPEAVATDFVRMWARPDADVEAWRASCQAMSTARFASVLDAASSAAVPASRVVGDTEVLERSEASSLVRVPTDGGAVLVRLERTSAGWRVDGIEPEELDMRLAGRS